MTRSNARGLKAAALLLSVFAITSSSRSQIPWPGVTGICENSKHVLFATIEDRTTVFSSADTGKSWAELFVPGGGLFNLRVAPNDILFGISDDGYYVVRSSDDGATWYSAYGVATADTIFYRLVITNKGTVLVSDPLSGCILRSTTNGKKWQAANTNVAGGFPNGLDLLGIDSSSNIYAASPAGGLSVSTDDGATWHATDIHAPESDWFSELCTTPTGVIYLSTPHAGIYRLTPGDTTLTKISSGMPSGNFLPLVVSPAGTMLTAPVDQINTVYHSAYRSENDGGSWSRSYSGMTDTAVEAVFASRSLGFFAGSAGGWVFRSVDEGRTWKKLEHNVVAPNTFDPGEVVALARNSNCNYFAATWGDGVFRSVDTAKTWTRVNTGLTDTLCWTIDVSPSNTLFVGTVTGAYRSIDNGDHWKSINAGFTYGGHEGDSLVTAFLPGLGAGILAATGHGVYRSTDNGDHWTSRYLPPSDPRFHAIITYCLERDDNGRVYAGGVGGFVARAASDSAEWETLAIVDSGNTGAYAASEVISMYAHGSTLLAGTDAGLFRSTDDGGSWARVGGELDSALVYSFFPPQNEGIYAQTSAGIFASKNAGGSWVYDDTLTTQGFQKFVSTAFDTNNCSVSSIGPAGSGPAKLLERATPTVGVHAAPVVATETNIINSPNPFAPLTNIGYQLTADAQVDLKIYSSLGVEVASLVHERQSIGAHSVQWSPKELPAGVYFCRMTITGSGSAPRVMTRRMDLVK